MNQNNKESEYQKENNRKEENAEKQINKNEKIVPRHEKLWVWQKSHKLMIMIFNLCKKLPFGERSRLGDQAQRSSKSVPDNISEGCSSYYFNNKIKCYRDSRKEAAETQNHIREMESKNYITEILSQKLIEEYEEVIRGLNGLINKTLELRELFNRKGIKRI